MRTTEKVKPQLLFPEGWVLKRPRGLNERPVSAKWGHPRAGWLLPASRRTQPGRSRQPYLGHSRREVKNSSRPRPRGSPERGQR